MGGRGWDMTEVIPLVAVCGRADNSDRLFTSVSMIVMANKEWFE